MKNGLTLLEMLIVIGIIAALTAATLGGYQHVLKAGERARAHELVSNVATALTAYFERERVWPKEIRTCSDNLLDENVAWYLRNDFSVDVAGNSSEDTSTDDRKSRGLDRFGIVTPWATAKLRKMEASLLESKSAGDIDMGNGTTVKDHIVRFAVDLDGDGIIENVSIGGVGKGSGTDIISVRATAIAWCCGKDGKIDSYSKGVREGGIYSWSYGQTKHVK